MSNKISSFIKESKVSLYEKIAYAMGDASANIAWRGVAAFLIIFYTDVFGLSPATVGMLMMVARFGDGVSDIAMGIIGDRTNSKYGKFRPWILRMCGPVAIASFLMLSGRLPLVMNEHASQIALRVTPYFDMSASRTSLLTLINLFMISSIKFCCQLLAFIVIC